MRCQVVNTITKGPLSISRPVTGVVSERCVFPKAFEQQYGLQRNQHHVLSASYRNSCQSLSIKHICREQLAGQASAKQTSNLTSEQVTLAHRPTVYLRTAVRSSLADHVSALSEAVSSACLQESQVLCSAGLAATFGIKGRFEQSPIVAPTGIETPCHLRKGPMCSRSVF